MGEAQRKIPLHSPGFTSTWFLRWTWVSFSALGRLMVASSLSHQPRCVIDLCFCFTPAIPKKVEVLGDPGGDWGVCAGLFTEAVFVWMNGWMRWVRLRSKRRQTRRSFLSTYCHRRSRGDINLCGWVSVSWESNNEHHLFATASTKRSPNQLNFPERTCSPLRRSHFLQVTHLHDWGEQIKVISGKWRSGGTTKMTANVNQLTLQPYVTNMSMFSHKGHKHYQPDECLRLHIFTPVVFFLQLLYNCAPLMWKSYKRHEKKTHKRTTNTSILNLCALISAHFVKSWRQFVKTLESNKRDNQQWQGRGAKGNGSQAERRSCNEKQNVPLCQNACSNQSSAICRGRRGVTARRGFKRECTPLLKDIEYMFAWSYKTAPFRRLLVSYSLIIQMKHHAHRENAFVEHQAVRWIISGYSLVYGDQPSAWLF